MWTSILSRRTSIDRRTRGLAVHRDAIKRLHCKYGGTPIDHSRTVNRKICNAPPSINTILAKFLSCSTLCVRCSLSQRQELAFLAVQGSSPFRRARRSPSRYSWRSASRTSFEHYVGHSVLFSRECRDHSPALSTISCCVATEVMSGPSPPKLLQLSVAFVPNTCFGGGVLCVGNVS